MRREKKGSMQKQAACIVLPKKRTLVGPSDLSSEEVPEESGQNRRIEADNIYVSKRLSIL
jgi:hypothetical protein